MNKLLNEIKGLRSKAEDNSMIMPSNISSAQSRKEDKERRTFSLFSRKVSSATTSAPTSKAPESITTTIDSLHEALAANGAAASAASSSLSPRSVPTFNPLPDPKRAKRDKQKELVKAKRQYKSAVSALRELGKHNVDIATDESNLAQVFLSYPDKVHEEPASMYIRQITTQFGTQLKKISALRSQLNERVTRDAMDEIGDLYHDYKRSTSSKKNLERETDFHLARRNGDYTEVVKDIAFSYLTYFETGVRVMRELEDWIREYEKAYADKVTREKFFADPASKVEITVPIVQSAAASNNLGGKFPATQVFSVPLPVIFERPGEPGPLPVIIEKLIQFLETKAPNVEGVFRVPGAISDIKRLKQEIDSGKSVNFDQEEISLHTMCGLLKQYTRDLPEPLLTFDKFDEFVEIAKIGNAEDRLTRLKEILNTLPRENFALLGRVMHLFKMVVDNQEKTKMTAANIAISFGMNLLDLKEPNPMKLAVSATWINKTCELLIVHCMDIWPEKIQNKQNGEPESDAKEENTDDELTEEAQDSDEDKKSKSFRIPNPNGVETSSPSSSVASPRKTEHPQPQSAPTPPSASTPPPEAAPVNIAATSPTATAQLSATAEQQSAGSPPSLVQPSRASLRGWLEILDPSRGRYYYFEPNSGEVSWLHPREQQQQQQTVDPVNKM